MKTKKMMSTDAIRTSFLNFYEKKGHKVIASDSLVPQDDPTLLFTGAGMNQFKEYFLGLKKDLKRAASSQKCLRTGDLDNVGRTAYHHSFFEMLGNFSFGDYFKEEAIAWAWEYLTEVLKIPGERLRVSVHQTDSEAFKVWRDKIKVKEAWIYKLGDESNFWPANAPADGPNGPCGPCSEIYYDMGKELLGSGEDPEDIESKRFAEIWNLVFTQYDRKDGGKLDALKNKNIDTGMGLERLACVLQDKRNNFEIDIFDSIHQSIGAALSVKRESQKLNSLNAIADHIRAVTFAISDGVIPSNEGRGYVIRKLIRRSLWHAHEVVPGKKIKEPFLYKVLPAVVKAMRKGYPDLAESAKSVEQTLKSEEERFLDTLENGVKILSSRLKELEGKELKVIPGEVVFELYDTYGFPDELTRHIADDHGFKIDQKGFDGLMEKQKTRAKEASQITGSIFVSSVLEEKLLALKPTKFLGYESMTGTANVLLAEIKDGKGIVALDQSPFYAESGGQVGDQGVLTSKKFRAKVVDTKKKGEVFVHYIEVEQGKVAAGDKIEGGVDAERRNRTMRNHTATHLLHAALRQVLGSQVRQLGSLVAPDRLRFDYSYAKALTPDQIQTIEGMVNAEILKSSPLTKVEKPVQEAKKEGAIAFFGEKYGDKVRVVTVPGFSKEFCGGTHCEDTGQIGSFLVVSESSVASGTRRIEALTGEGALEYTQKIRNQLAALASELKTSPAELPERVKKLKEQVKKLEKSKGATASLDAKMIAGTAVTAGRFKFIPFKKEEVPIPDLRHLSDQIRSGTQKTIYFLATENGDKIHFLSGVSHDLVKGEIDMRTLSSALSPLLQAAGGGRKDLVQGGGKNEGQLRSQWDAIVNTAVNYLKDK